MYCIKCGFKNVDEAIFCANCGSVMTKKPSDVDNQKIPTEENADNAEKYIPKEVQQIVSEVQTDLPEEIQPLEQVQPMKTEASGVSLEKQEAGQPDNVDVSDNSSGIPVDLYHSLHTSEQTENNRTYRIRKFSVSRFIFSLIIILATICSIVTIAFDYVGVNVEMNLFGEKINEAEYITGFDIIKEKVELDDSDILDEIDEYGVLDEFMDTLSVFRHFVIAFVVAMIIFCIIDFILLCLVRKKISYILTMVFSLLKTLLGGISIYLWSVEVLGYMEKMFKISIQNYAEFIDLIITLECMPSLGLILALVMQAVILISAVVLLCIRPKYQEVAQQTISA